MQNHCSPSANVAGIPSCGTVHGGPGGGAWIDEKHIHNVKHYVLVKICILYVRMWPYCIKQNSTCKTLYSCSNTVCNSIALK